MLQKLWADRQAAEDAIVAANRVEGGVPDDVMDGLVECEDALDDRILEATVETPLDVEVKVKLLLWNIHQWEEGGEPCDIQRLAEQIADDLLTIAAKGRTVGEPAEASIELESRLLDARGRDMGLTTEAEEALKRQRQSEVVA